MNATATKPEIFSVWSDEIVDRIDPFFYKPEFKELTSQLQKAKGIAFGEIIASITNGLDYRDFEEEGITDYLRVGNIKPYEIDLTEVKKVSLKSSEISKSIQLQKGDLLLTRKGTFGVAVTLDRNLDAIISSEIFLIRLSRKDVDPKYLEAFLNSSVGQKQFLNQKVGAIMGSLSQEAVKNVLVPIPTQAIQQKVIEIIRTAYAEKRKKEEEIKKILASIDDFVLGELGIEMPEGGAERVYEVWSDEVRGSRLDPFFHQTYFHELEKELQNGKHELVNLKDICVAVRGVTYSRDDEAEVGVKILRANNITLATNKLNFDDVRNIRADFPVNEEQRLKAGDILMCAASGSKEHVGKVAYISENTDFYFGSFMMVLRTNTDKINPQYLFEFLSSKIFRGLLFRILGGTNINNLNFSMIEDFEIPLPSIQTQEKIANKISSFRSQVKTLHQQAAEILADAQKQVEQMILA